MKRIFLIAALLLAGTRSAHAAYTQNVTFSFAESEISYHGGISTAYLLKDITGGLNPLCDAIPMTPSGGGTWSVTVPLAEGDYIYVFVANADAYVNLSDCGLNPDDVPDANFFNDPHPQDPGFGGQFGKDNVLSIRSPNRPRFQPATIAPLPGTLVTSASFNVSVQVQVGAAGTPIDPASARVRFETSEPPGLWRPIGPVPPDTLIDVSGVGFTFDAGTGRATITATINDPPEGFHRVLVDASGADGLAADTFTTSVIVNRDDQPPIADAGPTQFARAGGAVQLDGGESRDPDHIGFSAYAWRVISGPGAASFVYVDEEKVNRDGFGLPILDDDDLQSGVIDPAPNATPRFQPSAAGHYVVGLTVTDLGGHVSAEDTTDVYVVPSFDAATRARVTVSTTPGTIRVDGRDSSGPGAGYQWIADANNPAPLALTPSADGKQVTFPTPPAGVYFVHLQIGSSYPATAVIRVDAAGNASGSDFEKPSRFWTDDALMYLVFVRDFQDGDGDGIGDFAGLTQKLPYLKSLGVNAIWLMPITPSPTSHGYAATAHFLPHPDYGTLADFDAFTAAAHAAGMQVVFDLVANHTSNQHPFFQAAAANPASPLRALYDFNPDGTYDYAFDFATLPSWNYNSPVARELFLDVVDFWMDHGVDSIRCDIAGFVPPSFWQAMRRLVRGRSDDAMMLAEMLPPNAGYFDGRGFDMGYHAQLFWSFKDQFATTGGLDAVDATMDAAEHLIQDASERRAREGQDPANLILMRYLDNQDENRFLLYAGKNVSRQHAAAGALLALPGVPMIYYGDETGAVQQRGPMKFTANPDLLDFYRRMALVRNANAGLRGQDAGALGEAGDTYVRINGDSDPGGYAVFSFARYRAGQRFVALTNRFDASVLGTQVKYYPPPAILADFPDTGLFLQNQLDPTDILPADKASLAAGFTSSVGAYETKIYQLVDHPILDSDGDGVLDSWDDCIVAANGLQEDADRDGVGDACDACAATPIGAAVGLDGCAPVSAAPRRRYDVHDGKVDEGAYSIADGLWASWNGQELYVATRAATPGEDAMILLAADPSGVGAVPAPFGKAGTVAGATRALADEGDNDYVAWLGVTAQAIAGTPLVAVAEAAASGGSGDGSAVLEGTINLQEQFGDTLPDQIYLAAVRYGGADGGALVWQSPAAVTADGNVDATELLSFPLADPTPPPPPGPPDVDGDGVPDASDDCPGVPNADQADFDRDGVGDLCDMCPASDFGVKIDGTGCQIGAHDPQQPLGGDGQSLACGCRTTSRRIPTGAPILLLVLFVIERRRRRA